MVTIRGKARKEGVAIAVAAVIDTQNGINGVSPHLLEEGLHALKQGLRPEDYPEAVVICDNMVMGVSLRIPGVSTIGIAAQADVDIPGINPDVPCVLGAENLLDSVSNGDIVIIDGNSGTVHIDPDPQTIMHYQQIETQRESVSKIFISSEHIPARTQAGEMVCVYAYIANEGEVDQALSEGADGLLMDLRGGSEDSNYYKAIMRAAPGKPLAFAVDFPCGELLKAAARYSGPGQVTVLFPMTQFENLFASIDPILADIEQDAEAANVDIGTIARGVERDAPVLTTTRCLTLDLRRSELVRQVDNDELQERAGAWLRGREPEDVLLLIGKHVDSLELLVRAGARSIAVLPDKVSFAKYAIRCIGDEQ
ncbi:hypothetical protein LLG39_01185 [bacterium]|nr:hypothetical protein [bacterium]